MRVVFGAVLLLLALVVSSVPAQPTPMEGPAKVGGKTLGEWEKELTSKDPSKRAEAVISITNFDSKNSRTVPQLLKIAAHDRDVSPRVRAVIALRLVAVDDKDMRNLIQTLASKVDPAKESQAIVRLEAAVTLKRFASEPGMAMVVNELSKGAFDRTSWEGRYHCIGILWRVGQEQKTGADVKIYETLLSVLTFDHTYLVRLEILQGLGALGRPANQAVQQKVISTLNSAARSENKALAIWAYSGLVAMQDGELSKIPLAKIAGFLKTTSRLETRIQAAYALGALNKRAKSKVPLLIAMLKDPETNAVWAASNALGSIGDSSDKVIDACMELVGHKEASRSAAGVMALKQLKVKNARVTGTLDKMLGNKELDRRLRVVIEDTLKEFKDVKK